MGQRKGTGGEGHRGRWHVARPCWTGRAAIPGPRGKAVGETTAEKGWKREKAARKLGAQTSREGRLGFGSLRPCSLHTQAQKLRLAREERWNRESRVRG